MNNICACLFITKDSKFDLFMCFCLFVCFFIFNGLVKNYVSMLIYHQRLQI